MRVTEDPANDLDPLAYDPEDRIGLCLDVDGTVYRSGSVFIETLAFLPYADGFALTSADRRRRRIALRAVADYSGGFAARIKWRCLLTGLDALRVVGAERSSEALLEAVAERRAARATRPGDRSREDAPSISDADAYATMRRTVLSAYGELIRGKRATDVERAVIPVVERRCSVDSEPRATLDRLTRHADADVFLITDAPEHVATAYARNLAEDVQVRGTVYETDADGRYTGEFARADKRAAVGRLRAEREWDYVVAAGDAPVDAKMAREANLFLAVAGQGDLSRRLRGTDTVSLRGPDRDLRSELALARKIVRVPRDEPFARALRTVLNAVGVPAD